MKRFTSYDEIETLCEAMIKDFFRSRHYYIELAVVEGYRRFACMGKELSPDNLEPIEIKVISKLQNLIFRDVCCRILDRLGFGERFLRLDQIRM